MDKFLCADGTLCGLTSYERYLGLETRQSSCCDLFGGRLKCPKYAPVMCNDAGLECVDTVDNCTDYGGVRPCNELTQIPADYPRVNEFLSLSPSTYTLHWTRGIYNISTVRGGKYYDPMIRPSQCVFKTWKIEYLRVPFGRVWGYPGDPDSDSVSDSDSETLATVMLADFGNATNGTFNTSTSTTSTSTTSESLNTTTTSVSTTTSSATTSTSTTTTSWKYAVQDIEFHSPRNGPLWGILDWSDVPEADCNLEDRFTASCDVKGLEANVSYYLRIRELCDDTQHDSLWTATVDYLLLHPVPAEPPPFIVCGATTSASMLPEWDSAYPHNCTFVAWDVEISLIARSARYSSQGHLEAYLPGEDFRVACSVSHDRNVTTCLEAIDKLLSGRYYNVRVRETCTDPRANSPYTYTQAACPIIAVPAYPPTDFRALNPLPYTFDVEWVAGDPGACLFVAWEVQVRRNETEDAGTPWLQEGENTTKFGCYVLERNGTSCTVGVGLGSGTQYEVRVRETCSEPRFNSPWVYLPFPGVTTAMPERAAQVENMTITQINMTHFFIDWDAGRTRRQHVVRWFYGRQHLRLRGWSDLGCRRVIWVLRVLL
eukprot:TRINITY_DN7423_c0_g2_i1.p1 TRINITY_DN7423_c0_g2~~TRINITY_DN7423_c0_g2_i1.p1  ORF type:complete len:627 (-),score=35.88 TRINITY_DN7423_c0_g2_i1:25-1821(-)